MATWEQLVPSHNATMNNGDTIAFGDPVIVPAWDRDALDLVEMYACTVEAKTCSDVLRKLAEVAPLPNFMGHVKRVRKHSGTPGRLDLLLSVVHADDAVEEEPPESLQDADQLVADEVNDGAAYSSISKTGLAATSLPASVSATMKDACQRIFTVQVPRYPPHSKRDQLHWSRYWPASLRPPDKATRRNLIELLPEEKAAMRTHMATALHMAEENAALGSNHVCNACVIVNHLTGRVVGAAPDGSDAHPLHHAVMRAIEAVAAWQREVMYRDNRVEGAVNNGAEIDDLNKEGNDNKRRKTEESDCVLNGLAEMGLPYLCTGFDCFVVHEPCAMCAMALVHSRVRRVIFCIEDPEGGALGGSGLKLHSKRSLNHHYAVFKLPLSKNPR